tara:strand:+ start:768 stop:1724 length:957 start_codon:yes stop_codon:yes gene_type:complete
MNTLPWIEKYRPTKLDEIINHKNIVNILNKLITSNKFPHTIFYGQSGTGKTSTIISCAKQIYGDNYKTMVLELNGSDDRGIGVVRYKINDFCNYDSFFNKKIKLVILDEADSMTYDAQFALRKYIEDYTSTTRFCLICNYIYKIIDSLQSRCVIFNFSNITSENIKLKLIDISKKEKIKYTEEGIDAIINISDGDLRKAINYLQSLSLTVTTINEKNILKYTGYISDFIMDEILKILLNNDLKKSYKKVRILIKKYNICFIDLVKQSYKFINKMDLSEEQVLEFIKYMAQIEYNIFKQGNNDIQILSLISCFFKIKYI